MTIECNLCQANFKTFTVEHTTTVSYHPRSNRQVEYFVDTFKGVLRKSNMEVMDEVQQS